MKTMDKKVQCVDKNEEEKLVPLEGSFGPKNWKQKLLAPKNTWSVFQHIHVKDPNIKSKQFVAV